jgi:glucokinase
VRAILADIGGTNVRFATLTSEGKIEAVEAWLTALYPDFGAAARAYADVAGLQFPIQEAGICAAGPLIEGRIELTNCAWKISRDEIALATGASTVALVNDFAAAARAVPELSQHDLVQIGGGEPVPGAPKVALGPGTGLGVASVVLDRAGHWLVQAGEGGHVDLAPTNARELAVVFQLIREHGHVSVERVLSGPGLENLYLTIASLDGLSIKQKPVAHDIASAARTGSDPAAVEAVSLFTGWLGSVAGNVALVLGARGGIYIAGGIVSQWGDLFDGKLFRHRFEAKGRMNHYLAPIPCYAVTAKDLAFRGLAALCA